MRSFFLFCFLFLTFQVHAQEDDYFPSPETKEKPTRPNRLSLASEKFPHHEKLSLEVFGNASFSQILDLYGLFAKTTGGFGGDVGMGLRVRLYHKLALVIGGTYSNKPAQYEYGVTFFSGGQGEAIIGMRNQYAGIYGKLMLEFTRKFWMALYFEKSFVFAQELTEQTVKPNGGVAYTDSTLYNYHFPFGLIDQFDIGLNIGMRFPIAGFMNIKPFVMLQVATEGIMRTNQYGPKFPFGKVGEANPSFVHLKLGAIFEIPLLPPKAPREKNN